jgi:hypothetical protein
MLELIKQQLNAQLASEFDGVILDYDLSNIEALQENFTEKLANAEALYRMGYTSASINRRLELGFEDDEIPEELELEEPDPIANDNADDETDDEQVKRMLKAVGYGK